jgi:hypothetical protein
LITAAGYDYVPGNLAGGLALEAADGAATAVEIGYFNRGKVDSDAMSGGTASSLAGTVLEPGHAYRDGRIKSERGARHVRSFPVGGKDRAAVSVGGSEHFTLPRSYPGLTDVEVCMGWFGPASRAFQVGSAGIDLVTKLPGARGLIERGIGTFVKGSTGGPDAEARSRTSSHIVAIARDGEGRELADVHVTGVNGYTFTGDFMAWAAIEAAERGLKGTGAIGPVEAFGLDRLAAGCADCGLTAGSGN